MLFLIYQLFIYHRLNPKIKRLKKKAIVSAFL